MAEIVELYPDEFEARHEGGFDRLLSASDSNQLVGIHRKDGVEIVIEVKNIKHFVQYHLQFYCRLVEEQLKLPQVHFKPYTK